MEDDSLFASDLVKLLENNPYGMLKYDIAKSFGMNTNQLEQKLKGLKRDVLIAEDDENGLFIASARERYINLLKKDLYNRIDGHVFINGRMKA